MMGKTKENKITKLLNEITTAYEMLSGSLNEFESFKIIFALLYYKRFNDILEIGDKFAWFDPDDISSEDILPEENRWHYLLNASPLQIFVQIGNNIRNITCLANPEETGDANLADCSLVGIDEALHFQKYQSRIPTKIQCELVNIFNSLDLSFKKISYREFELAIWIFEEKYLKNLNKEKGFRISYTPPHLAKLIVKLLDHDGNDEYISCYTPDCGFGGVLNLIIDHMCTRKGKVTKSPITLNEKDLEIVALIKLRLATALISNGLLNGVAICNLQQPDDIEKMENANIGWGKEIAIFFNPPFGTLGRIIYPPNIKINGQLLEIDKYHGELFELLQHLRKLNDRGRMSALIPLSLLFDKNTREIRKFLINNDYVDAVIQLPADYSTVYGQPTVILVINKNKSSSRKFKTFFTRVESARPLIEKGMETVTKNALLQLRDEKAECHKIKWKLERCVKEILTEIGWLKEQQKINYDKKAMEEKLESDIEKLESDIEKRRNDEKLHMDSARLSALHRTKSIERDKLLKYKSQYESKQYQLKGIEEKIKEDNKLVEKEGEQLRKYENTLLDSRKIDRQIKRIDEKILDLEEKQLIEDMANRSFDSISEKEANRVVSVVNSYRYFGLDRDIDAVVTLVDIQQQDYDFSPERYIGALSKEMKELVETRAGKYLGTLCDVSRGGSRKPDPDANRGLPFITTRDLAQDVIDPYLNYDKCFLGVPQTHGNVFDKKSILVSFYGNTLKPTIFNPETANKAKPVLNGHDHEQHSGILLAHNLVAIVPNERLVDFEYMYYQLYSPMVKKQIETLLIGQKLIPRTILQGFKKIVIPVLESLEAQRAYAKQQKLLLFEAENIKLEAIKARLGISEKKQAAEYEIVRHLAHDIKPKINIVGAPLRTIRDLLNNEGLLDNEVSDRLDGTKETAREAIKKALEGLGQITNVLDSARAIVTREIKRDDFQKIIIDDLFENKIKPLYENEPYRIIIDCKDKELEVYLHVKSFIEAINNIIRNAEIHAFSDDISEPKLIFKIYEDVKEEEIVIDYTNNGCPFPSSMSKDEFLSFGKKSIHSEGEGLGGAWIEKVVAAHEGSFEIIRDDNPVHFRLKFAKEIK